MELFYNTLQVVMGIITPILIVLLVYFGIEAVKALQLTMQAKLKRARFFHESWKLVEVTQWYKNPTAVEVELTNGTDTIIVKTERENLVVKENA